MFTWIITNIRKVFTIQTESIDEMMDRIEQEQRETHKESEKELEAIEKEIKCSNQTKNLLVRASKNRNNEKLENSPVTVLSKDKRSSNSRNKRHYSKLSRYSRAVANRNNYHRTRKSNLKYDELYYDYLEES